MQELKEDLREHMAQDRADFTALNDKLDTQNSKLDQIIGQWKLVGALAGAFAGFVGAIIAAVI